MSTFIKVGFWEKLCKPCKGYKGWLNLDEFITNIVTALIPPAPESTYKVYTALLTKTGPDGTTPPVATILENTLGNITFGISSVGNYTVESNGLFITDKTYFSVSFGTDTSTGILFGINDESSLYIEGYVITINGLISINNLYNTPIEIRVYN
jgi:hypothetical protein